MWWTLGILPWLRRRRTRQAEARARAVQAAEHRAAKRRILEHNGWNAPTRVLDNRPLFTMGQLHRTRHLNRGGPKRDDPGA